jgi:hypothetical protein
MLSKSAVVQEEDQSSPEWWSGRGGTQLVLKGR